MIADNDYQKASLVLTYYLQHEVCPACRRNDTLCTTTLGSCMCRPADGTPPPFTDPNWVSCGCGWEGPYDDLVPGDVSPHLTAPEFATNRQK